MEWGLLNQVQVPDGNVGFKISRGIKAICYQQYVMECEEDKNIVQQNFDSWVPTLQVKAPKKILPIVYFQFLREICHDRNACFTTLADNKLHLISSNQHFRAMDAEILAQPLHSLINFAFTPEQNQSKIPTEKPRCWPTIFTHDLFNGAGVRNLERNMSVNSQACIVYEAPVQVEGLLPDHSGFWRWEGWLIIKIP